jgi:hypothetical protein
MIGDTYTYQDDEGVYIIEGFQLGLRGTSCQLVIAPKRYLPPSLVMDVSAFGDRLQGQVTLDGPPSLVSAFLEGLEQLISGSTSAVVFPSSDLIRFVRPTFDCRIGLSSRERRWTMFCRCGAPTLWRSESPPEFGAMLQFFSEVDEASLETFCNELRQFLFWFDRQQFASWT